VLAKEDQAVKKIVLVAVAAALVGFQMLPGQASSHREAPLISQDPTADNTDVYAFVSPDRPDSVTMIANYIPLEQPAGGPNFPAFDDSVLYEIHVDNDGNGEEDISFQFRFHTDTRNPDTFLYNTGVITSLTDPDWNRPQTYSVTLVRHGSAGFSTAPSGPLGAGTPDGVGGREQTTVLGTNIPTPPDNIGPRSTPGYDALATAAITTLPGGIKVFAGQRDDPFFVDLGSIFDLAGLRPFNPAHIIPLPADAGHDGVANFNTHSIAIQVPIAQLVRPGQSTIGIYASASRQQVRLLRKDGEADSHGQFIQVSRLGQPLINEVVIPLGQKDQWNRSDPAADAQFESLYLNPEVSRLENLLYGGALAPINTTGRADLVAILLTGVPGVNFTGNTRADLLRVNTALVPHPNGACYHPALNLPPTTPPSRLSVIDGDLCGYPNGRRLLDDIVDVDLRAFAEGYGPILNAVLGLPNKSPNNQLGDGVDGNEPTKPFLTTFPYVAAPHQGYQVP
jgi:hypothetical protein